MNIYHNISRILQIYFKINLDMCIILRLSRLLGGLNAAVYHPPNRLEEKSLILCLQSACP